MTIAPLVSEITPLAETNSSSLFQQAATTAKGLARAARNLPDADRLRATQAALSIILLVEFDRLLPSMPPANLEQFANIFLSENPDPAEQLAAAAKLPPSDTLVFDGSRLAGGNFQNIDALIGMGGRPIALDRELPAWIVPLESNRAQALDSTRAAGLSPQKFTELQSLFNRIHIAKVSDYLISDGIFLRPYAGKMDDLYHELIQKGGRGGQLDYFALLDSLPPRQYNPLVGTASREFVPPSRTNLSNILSGGSLQAIQNFKAANPRANIKNPFKGFAIRTLPFLPEQLKNTAPGRSLNLSGELMRRVINDTSRFYTPKVQPLFHDPSRFLGQWEDPRYLLVAKKKKNANADLFAEIQKVDFETPLPEMSFEPAGNELLAQSPPTSDADDTVSLLEDLGMPPQSQNATYEPAEAPEPVLPPTRMKNAEAPLPKEPLDKPAPPLLDSFPLETPPVFELAQAEAPTEAPALVQQLTLPASPSPQFLKPSAIAVIPPSATPAPPQTETNLVDKVTKTETRIAKAIPVEPSQEGSAEFSDSPSRRFQVAVLTPTAVEAIEYLKKIAASDITLSENLGASRRQECLIRWLGEAVKPFEPLLTNSPEIPEAVAVKPLIIQARDEIVTLLAQRETLQSARMQELKMRQSLRQDLEKEIQTTRRDELTRRTGTGA